MKRQVRLSPGKILSLLWNNSLSIKTRVDIGAGARLKIADMLHQLRVGQRLLFVCQPAVQKLWGQEVLSVLQNGDAGARFYLHQIDVPDGEECKSPEYLLKFWKILQEQGFDREDTIVVLGGGSLSDLAGFAAATYMRGINLVIIPTTLLSQVDAAIGGKTGINLQSAKNLAGSFYFPAAVIVDSDLLSSLPAIEFRSGLGEIIKYALIEDTIASKSAYEKGPRKLLDILEESLDFFYWGTRNHQQLMMDR